MMMVRSPDSKKKGIAVVLAACVLFTVIFFSSPLAVYVRGAFAGLLARRADTAAAAEYGSLSRDALIARLRDAERQLTLVKYQSVLYGLLADENAKLLKALNANPPPGSVLARVLSRPPETAYDTLLVDSGAHSGIEKGDIVEYQNVALGRIVSTGSETALVQLFSSPGNDEDVLVGAPAAIAVAHGLGGGAFELSVPQGITATSGDAVRLSAAGSLLFGVVANISSKAGDVSQTVRVRSPVSLADLDFVEVLTGTPQKQ